MANLRLITNNLSDDIKLNIMPSWNDSSSVVNLQNSARSKVFRTDLSESADIKVENSLSYLGSGLYLESGYTFDTSGTRYYTSDADASTNTWKIDYYTLTTAYDLTTATLVSTLSAVEGVDHYIGDLQVSLDGRRLYVTKKVIGTGVYVYQYLLARVWDISTALVEQTLLFPASSTDTITSGFITNDGLSLYYIANRGSATDDTTKYTLTTPWDINTASLVSASSIFPTFSYVETARIDKTGKYIYTLSDNSIVTKYSISTAHDLLSTITKIEDIRITTVEGTIGNMYLTHDSTRLYIETARYYNHVKIIRYMIKLEMESPHALSTYIHNNNAFIEQSNTDETKSFMLSPDGTRLYVQVFSNLRQYNLDNTPGNIYDIDTYDYSTNNTTSKGMRASADGTKIFFINNNSIVYTRSVTGAAWEFGQGLTTATSVDFSADVTSISAFDFNSDGTKMFLNGTIYANIIEYNLSTAWDVSTASLSTSTLVPSISGTAFMLFIDNGKHMISGTGGTDPRVIRLHSLSTAYDASSTITLVEELNLVSLGINGIHSLIDAYLAPNAQEIYLADSSTHTISKYVLKVPNSILSISNPADLAIRGNFLPNKDINSVILSKHNALEGTLLQVRLYADKDRGGASSYKFVTITSDTAGSAKEAFGSFIFGNIPFGYDPVDLNTLPIWFDTDVSAGSFEILIYPIVPSAAYTLEIGRLVVGKYLDIPYNISYGHTLSYIENVKQYRTDGGTLRSDNSPCNKKLTFSLNTIPEVSRPALISGLKHVGLRKDFYASLFPEDNSVDKEKDYSGIFKLTKIPVTQEFQNNYYKSKYEMEEA